MAEGSTRSYETPEPDTHLKTTVVPVVSAEESAKSAAETGLVTAVNLSAEGKDDDDVQDASLEGGETQSDPETQKKTSSQAEDSTPKVLIVEDTTELAEIIQATLERMNLKTFHETHGNKAIARFNDLDPEVVLLDISLPDTTGWKILEFIKKRHDETNGKMPIVIVITAYDDPANRLVGKLQGIHSYLIKPFTSDEIETVVKQALSGAEQ